MNLEDLILDTQISELTRLQIGSIKARDTIQRIQAQISQLDDQAARAKAEIQRRQDTTTQRQIERVEAEVKKLCEQTANQTANQHQAARAAHAEHIKALNAQLKQDIADCQQQLQAKISELHGPEDCVNSHPELKPQEERSTNAISNDLTEPPITVTDMAVPSQHSEIDQQISDLEQQVRDAIQKKFGPRSKLLNCLPAANVELTSAESGTTTISDHVNLAVEAAKRFAAKKPSIWGRGLPLLIVGLLLFCVGTVASAVSKIDLGSLMSFDLSEANITWLGISCGIGLIFSAIVAFVIRKLASRSIKQAAQEMLLHTSNAKAVAELLKNNSDSECITPAETTTPTSPLLQSVPQKNPLASKPELKNYDHQRDAKLQAAAHDQVNALVSRHAEQIDQQLTQFEDQFRQFTSTCAEANSSVESWRNKELTRIHNHCATSLEQAFSKLAQEVQTKYDQLSTEAAKSLSRWKANVLIASEVARISTDRATQFPAWEELCLQGWTIPSSLPVTLTVGNLQLTMPGAPETIDGKLESELNIQLPGLLNFPRDSSIAIEHDAAGRKTALDFVRAMVLRLLTSMAPGQVQFTFIDPVSPQQSFSGLTRLAEYNEKLIDGQVWSDSSEIENSLRRVSERTELILKEFLESGANSLDEHNAMSTDGKEPYHIVIVAGFPKDFTEEAARLLDSILNGGALCGVHVIAMWSPDLTLPKTFKIKTLQKNCTQFHVQNGAVLAGSSLSINHPSELVQFTAMRSPSLEHYETIVSAVGKKSQPIELVKEAEIEHGVHVEQTESSERSVVSSTLVDDVTAIAVPVAEEPSLHVQPIAISSSHIIPDVIDNPVSENQAPATYATEAETTGQGIAAIPVNQSRDHDPSIVTARFAEFPFVEAPVVEVPVTEVAIEEAVALHNDDVRKDPIDQSSIREVATTVTAPLIEHCAPLNEKLRQEFLESQACADGVSVWIGESDGNTPTDHKFLRARGQNTLIVGQNDDLADAVFASTILSLCAGRASGHAQSPKVILVHDGLNHESLRRFAASFSDAVTPRFAIRSEAGVDAVVAELLEEMNAREKNRAAKNAPEIVFAVRNIGRFPSLRRDYQQAENGASKSAPRFGDLLRQGPRVGIHVVTWADTFETALQCLSNSLLREFDTRIALKMNAQDSTSLISRPDAELIDTDSAILYSEQTGSVHQFRPFAWPPVEWLATLPQTTFTVAIAATEASNSDIASTDSAGEQAEPSDCDGFTLAADVVLTGTTVQPTSETSSNDFEIHPPATHAAPNSTAPSPTEDSGASAASESATASFKSKSARGTRRQATSVPSPPTSDAEMPPKAAPQVAPASPNVVASAAVAARKANQAPSEKRVSGMAMRMSSRNSDPLRPLDAPPERQVQVVSNQPAPDADFDEMDFDSLLIE